jgi:hypothetical protein
MIRLGRISYKTHAIIVPVLLSFMLAACSIAAPGDPPVSTAPETAPPLPTGTLAPSPTDTPLPSLVVLLTPPGADPSLAASLQTLLTDLAAQDGLRFQVRPSLDPTELDHVQVVVAIPPDPGLAELTLAAPETQFLAIGIAGLEPAPNLSTIGAEGARPDHLGFLAGYTAAEITLDYRVGVVTEGDTPAGDAASLGYTNGVFYFCGLCRPVYPPFPTAGYPLIAQLPAEAGPADWQGVLTYLNAWQVGTVFVYPSVAEDKLLEVLAQSEVNFIIVGSPPENLRGNWVASLGSEDPLSSIQTLWPKLVSGEGGIHVSLPLGFTAVNPDLLSPGRQRNAETMLADLLTGYISTGVDAP